MKFSLTTETTAPRCEYSFGPLALAEMQNDLSEAYESLDASIKGMQEVTDVMENIQASLNLLSTYGQSAVSQLNIDKGLESLMGVPEKLITAEKAMEEMEDQKKSLWQKFKEYITRIWEAIKNLFKALLNKEFTTTVVQVVEKTVEVIKEKPVVVEKIVEIPVDRIVEKEKIVEVEKPVVVEKIIEKAVTNGVAEEEARVWESLANETAAKLTESQQKVKELQAAVDALKNIKVTVDDSATAAKLDEMNKRIAEVGSKGGDAFAKLAAMIEAIGDPASKSQLEGIVKKIAQVEQFYRENNNKFASLMDEAKKISTKVDQANETTLKGLGWTNETLLKHAEELKRIVVDSAPKFSSASDLIMADVSRVSDKVGEIYNEATAATKQAAERAQAVAEKVKRDIADQAQRVGAQAVKFAQTSAIAVVQTKNKVMRPLHAVAAAARAMGEAAKTAYNAEMAKQQ